MWFLGKEKVSTRGRKRILTDSERKLNRSEISSKWNKCRICVGDQLDSWNELKEVLPENDNNFGYEKITILVDNIPLIENKNIVN
jgi:hypothetical protein